MRVYGFEYALYNNECDSFFKGEGTYFHRSERDEHDYGVGIWCALNEIKENKVQSSDFVASFGSFIKGLSNNEKDFIHFEMNLYYYLLQLYKYEEIEEDILFNDLGFETTLKKYMMNESVLDRTTKLLSYIKTRFPQAKLLTYF